MFDPVVIEAASNNIRTVSQFELSIRNRLHVQHQTIFKKIVSCESEFYVVKLLHKLLKDKWLKIAIYIISGLMCGFAQKMCANCQYESQASLTIGKLVFERTQLNIIKTVL